MSEKDNIKKQDAPSIRLNELLGIAKDALFTAKETIKIWHGGDAWNEYQLSPEMVEINFAISAIQKFTKQSNA